MSHNLLGAVVDNTAIYAGGGGELGGVGGDSVVGGGELGGVGGGISGGCMTRSRPPISP